MINGGANITETADFTATQNKFNQIYPTVSRIYIRMQNAGGNLAKAAEIIAVPMEYDPTRTDLAYNNKNSIYSQLTAGLILGDGTKFPTDIGNKLNDRRDSIPPIVAKKTETPALTQRG